jgi:hypothetical protein
MHPCECIEQEQKVRTKMCIFKHFFILFGLIVAEVSTDLHKLSGTFVCKKYEFLYIQCTYTLFSYHCRTCTCTCNSYVETQNFIYFGNIYCKVSYMQDKGVLKGTV